MYKFHGKNHSKQHVLLVSIIICAYSSFLFGWHVHEKAILMILIPFRFVTISINNSKNSTSVFSLLAADNGKYSKIYFMLSTIGNYSLFPLLFRYQGKSIGFYFKPCIINLFFKEYPLKATLWLIFTVYNFYSLKIQHK